MDRQVTCQYRSCAAPATHLVDGVPYCQMDATYYLHSATHVERIAPTATPAQTGAPAPRTTVDGWMHSLTGLDSPARRRNACHTCGLPLNRRGECEECQ